MARLKDDCVGYGEMNVPIVLGTIRGPLEETFELQRENSSFNNRIKIAINHQGGKV